MPCFSDFLKLVNLNWLTILDLLTFFSSRQIKVLDHVQFGNSCHVVKAVFSAELIKFGAQIDFNFWAISNFAID
jgi:hypothetical protein